MLWGMRLPPSHWTSERNAQKREKQKPLFTVEAVLSKAVRNSTALNDSFHNTFTGPEQSSQKLHAERSLMCPFNTRQT